MFVPLFFILYFSYFGRSQNLTQAYISIWVNWVLLYVYELIESLIMCEFSFRIELSLYIFTSKWAQTVSDQNNSHKYNWIEFEFAILILNSIWRKLFIRKNLESINSPSFGFLGAYHDPKAKTNWKLFTITRISDWIQLSKINYDLIN